MGRIAGVTAEQTRERILAAATHLFAERGFDGVRMRDLSIEAQANVATIAYHFGDKRGLYEAVVDEMYDGLRSFGDQLEIDPTGDPVADLLGAAWAFANAHRDALRVVHRVLVQTGGADPRVADEWLGGRVDAYTARLVSWFGLAEDAARLMLVSLQFLVARYVLSNTGERCRLMRTDDPEEADARIVAHLVDLSKQMLVGQPSG